MPQKRSTYGDIITAATETNSPTTEGEEQQTDATITVTETHPTETEEEDTPGTNTPLPSTPVQCSTSHGTRPRQPQVGLQTPIRATVSAGVTPKKEIASPEKGKLKTIEKEKPKNRKVHFEPPTDLRRSNRIKDAERTEKSRRDRILLM